MPEQANWRSIEDMNMFQEVERLSDEVWEIVTGWNLFAKDTIGKQLVRAIDSIGANLVEGDGRYHHKETLNFYYVARGSLRETRYWIKRAQARQLLRADQADSLQNRLEPIRRWINTLISQRRQWIGEIHEQPADYTT